MNILDIVIALFIFLESLNIIILYYFPEFKYGNGVYAFKVREKFAQDESLELFGRYMTNWVAGSKIIFVSLLLIILFRATDTVKLYSVIVLIPCIATYFFKLHPIIKRIDQMGDLKPKGYSKVLFWNIAIFISMFLLAVIFFMI